MNHIQTFTAQVLYKASISERRLAHVQSDEQTYLLQYAISDMEWGTNKALCAYEGVSLDLSNLDIILPTSHDWFNFTRLNQRNLLGNKTVSGTFSFPEIIQKNA